jgi:hypothetical protein
MWMMLSALTFFLFISTGRTSFETSKLGIVCAMPLLVTPGAALFLTSVANEKYLDFVLF